MLARVAGISLLCAFGLAACQTDSTATRASTESTTSAPHVALLTPPSAGSGLVGWDADKIRGLYGKPSFIRTEKESELWRYDGQSCAAFFVMYRETAGMRVRYVQTYPSQGAMGDAACLAGIKARAGVTS